MRHLKRSGNLLCRDAGLLQTVDCGCGGGGGPDRFADVCCFDINPGCGRDPYGNEHGYILDNDGQPAGVVSGSISTAVNASASTTGGSPVIGGTVVSTWDDDELDCAWNVPDTNGTINFIVDSGSGSETAQLAVQANFSGFDGAIGSACGAPFASLGFSVLRIGLVVNTRIGGRFDTESCSLIVRPRFEYENGVLLPIDSSNIPGDFFTKQHIPLDGLPVTDLPDPVINLSAGIVFNSTSFPVGIELNGGVQWNAVLSSGNSLSADVQFSGDVAYRNAFPCLPPGGLFAGGPGRDPTALEALRRQLGGCTGCGDSPIGP